MAEYLYDSAAFVKCVQDAFEYFSRDWRNAALEWNERVEEVARDRSEEHTAARFERCARKWATKHRSDPCR